jgi:hypothetical protein
MIKKIILMGLLVEAAIAWLLDLYYEEDSASFLLAGISNLVTVGFIFLSGAYVYAAYKKIAAALIAGASYFLITLTISLVIVEGSFNMLGGMLIGYLGLLPLALLAAFIGAKTLGKKLTRKEHM